MVPGGINLAEEFCKPSPVISSSVLRIGPSGKSPLFTHGTPFPKNSGRRREGVPPEHQTPARLIRPRPTPNSAPTHVKRSSVLPLEKSPHPLRQNPEGFPKLKKLRSPR